MLKATVNDKNAWKVEHINDGWFINEESVSLDVSNRSAGLMSVIYNEKSYTAFIENIDRKAKEIKVNIDGRSFNVAIKEPIDQLLSSMGMDLKAMQKIEPVKAPMPGMVLKVLVEPGQQINKGDGLLVLEAMKMENILKASTPAIVKSIKINERTAVEKGTVLIELE